MKIALIGSRGIPARYSGFETFYEQLAIRLVEIGHDVTVYNRSHFIKDIKDEYKGVRIVSLPSIQSKHLDTISHTFMSSLHALFKKFDIVYYCIVGNSPLVWLPRMLGAKTLLNVDGEDWAREKWSGFAKKYQLWCEKVACKTANVVVSDAIGIQKRYLEKYNHNTIFVPYGANLRDAKDSNLLQKWNIEKDNYFLYVGRFVPENSIDILIKAYNSINTRKKLVLVGDAPYASEYKKYLSELARNNSNIVFTGYAFEKEYEQLSSNAYLYIQPSGIDGTRPALLDQMGFGNCVLVRNSNVNMEVINGLGEFFDKNDQVNSLAAKMKDLENNPDRVKYFRGNVQDRIKDYYNWEYVTLFYEDLFERLVNKQEQISYSEFLKTRKEVVR